MGWDVFVKWTEFENIDIEKLSWNQTQILMKCFENEKNQNSFNYRRAINLGGKLINKKLKEE